MKLRLLRLLSSSRRENSSSLPHQADLCGKWWNCDEASEGASATFLVFLIKLSVFCFKYLKQKGCVTD